MGKYDSSIIQKVLFFEGSIIVMFYSGVSIEFIMLHGRSLEYLTKLLSIPMMKMGWIIYLKALAVNLRTP